MITGDAASLPHRDNTFDLVITDPPYFNNVHYSELADFFHAWLKNLNPYEGYASRQSSTRDVAEVQDADVGRFCEALERVFGESSRVLKPEGLMAFSFHHGDADAWKAVASALHASGFAITSVQPVKAEMSTSSTKHRSKEPNNLDSIVVCRPVETANKLGARSAREATCVAEARLTDLREAGISVGLGDVRSVVTGSVVATATSPGQIADLDTLTARARELAEQACQTWAT